MYVLDRDVLSKGSWWNSEGDHSQKGQSVFKVDELALLSLHIIAMTISISISILLFNHYPGGKSLPRWCSHPLTNWTCATLAGDFQCFWPVHTGDGSMPMGLWKWGAWTSRMAPFFDSLGLWLWTTQKVCTWDCWQSKGLILIIPYSLDGWWLTSPLITFLIDLNWMGPSVFLKIFHTFDGKNMQDPRCFQMFPADLHRQKSQGWGGSPGCGDVGQAAFAELELIKRMNSWPEYPSEIENLLDTTLMTFMNLVHRSLLSVPFPLLDGVDGQVSSTRSRISCSCSTATISRSQALLQHTMAGQNSVRHLFFL